MKGILTWNSISWSIGQDTDALPSFPGLLCIARGDPWSVFPHKIDSVQSPEDTSPFKEIQ